MEIEVGEYIRVDNGIILRYDFIQKNNDEILLGQKGKVYSFEDEEELEDFIKLRIVKHSKNIIDLIQCGDYVNRMKVIATENRGRYNEEKQKDEKVILVENYDEWTENGVISNEDIKTILTKEQYEQNSYKI